MTAVTVAEADRHSTLLREIQDGLSDFVQPLETSLLGFLMIVMLLGAGLSTKPIAGVEAAVSHESSLRSDRFNGAFVPMIAPHLGRGAH